MNRHGQLYVFEGPDAVGKSTISAHFAERLRQDDQEVLLLSFPGKEHGTLGLLVNHIHHAPKGFGIDSLHPASLQILHIAAHIDTIENRIKPALAAGITVVLDRYWWSSFVYGKVYGVENSALEAMLKLESIHWGQIQPKCLFLIFRDKPLDSTLDTKVWSRLRNGYNAALSDLAPEHAVEIIHNNGDIETVLERISSLVNGRLHKPRKSTSQSLRLRSASLAPAKPTIVYDTYWQFAYKRQEILFHRLNQSCQPYTDDPILKKYRFTNAYRVADRVSQYLIQHVIVGALPDAEDLFFRIMLYKTFNSIQTWERLHGKMGEIHWSMYDFRLFSKTLEAIRRTGESIYSAAYIMPSGNGAFGHARKHDNHLSLIESMMKDGVPAKVEASKSLKQVFELLCSYPMIGPFLGYQYAIDLNYSNLTDFSEMEFVIPGPGARDGICKCFTDLGGLNEAEIIRRVADIQEEEFQRLELPFRTLGGRLLQLIDCQNLFCEVDKYARVAHPDVIGISGRTRIKQQYRQDPRPFRLVLPPKWGVTLTFESRENNDFGTICR